MTLAQWTPADVAEMRAAGIVRGHDAALLAHVPDDPGGYEQAGPAWTLRCRRSGAVVFAAGCIPFWRGVAEVWALSTMLTDHYARDVWRFARWATDDWWRSGNLHRMQAHVRDGNEQGLRFIQRLGLSVEARCPRYWPDGSAAWLFARVAP